MKYLPLISDGISPNEATLGPFNQRIISGFQSSQAIFSKKEDHYHQECGCENSKIFPIDVVMKNLDDKAEIVKANSNVDHLRFKGRIEHRSNMAQTSLKPISLVS
jgi:hypothetical protein